jgi:hypothetical protein
MTVEKVRKENVAAAVEKQEEGKRKLAMDLMGKDFHHPFTPYKIQEEFMETVYQILEAGGSGVGILESPTGTVCILFIFLI